jgi:hypothetical protein
MSHPQRRDESLTVPDVPALPRDGAFIVEFRTGAATAPAERLDGRVEHVVSGLATRFGSADELIGFVRDVLRSCAQTRAGEESGPGGTEP